MHMKKRFRKGKALYLILILELELSRTYGRTKQPQEIAYQTDRVIDLREDRASRISTGRELSTADMER
jgi:hypothetical protein